MPWMVSLDAVEFDLLALERELLRRGHFEAQKLLREFFSDAREGCYVDDVSKHQRCMLSTFKSDGIISNFRIVSNNRGDLWSKKKN